MGQPMLGMWSASLICECFLGVEPFILSPWAAWQSLEKLETLEQSPQAGKQPF